MLKTWGRSERGATATHQVLAAHVHDVPRPFRTFAVRSDEPLHAMDARAPYGRVHRVHTRFLDAAALARLAAAGDAQTCVEAFSDVAYAATSLQDLAATAGLHDLVAQIAAAVQLTGVLGNDPASYLVSVSTRIDYLACCGAGFHNDVAGPWSRSLFWLLALDVHDVAFVMPHAGLRCHLVPGDLLVFDQTMAHGLCRPHDDGLALAASFEGPPPCRQMFLTGELLLSDAQWAALGAPWLPVQAHERCAALDLMVAEFDERSGTIQRPRALLDGMKLSTCHVDEAAVDPGK